MEVNGLKSGDNDWMIDWIPMVKSISASQENSFSCFCTEKNHINNNQGTCVLGATAEWSGQEICFTEADKFQTKGDPGMVITMANH
ncbi:hypothetical protein KFK09_007374 [Dendrobium nobile]|uniref:Uncharacterized protein n=1 Tax=Dendrobium nobile TaxID=94219 RepID=A0A8T3BWP7_DENNO|nr:hypothetical protein KFK09_007374 [Dendrobium nobile]